MIYCLSGAAQADVAVLVVNSTRGEFETGFEAGGQTREHAMLIRSLGNYTAYVLAITFMNHSLCYMNPAKCDDQFKQC